MLLGSKTNNPRTIAPASENFNSSNRKNLKPEMPSFLPFSEHKSRTFNKIINSKASQKGGVECCENHSSTRATYISRTHGE